MNVFRSTLLRQRVVPVVACRAMSTSAAAAAEYLLAHHGNVTTVRRQVLDPNQLSNLAFTLGRLDVGGVTVSEAEVLPAGTPVPPGYHLVYFTPGGREQDLGRDGTDRGFNAQAPFTRRMWAGGAMKWTPGVDLRIGDTVEERTRLLSAAPKTSQSTGNAMVLVEVEKEFWGPRGLALVDRRSWIFRPAVEEQVETRVDLPPFINSQDITTIEDSHGPEGLTRTFCWSPVGLFRFSAITFNAHKIHYNEDWAHRVESHPGIVVHGPMNLINLLNYWQDAHGAGVDRSVHSITYRAVAPIYGGEHYQVRTKAEGKTASGETRWDVVAEKNGKPCMVAEIQ